MHTDTLAQIESYLRSAHDSLDKFWESIEGFPSYAMQSVYDAQTKIEILLNYIKSLTHKEDASNG